QVFDTNYTGTNPSNNFIGSLAFGPDNDLYTVGFNLTDETNPGTLLKFDIDSDDRTLIATNQPTLQRPIGLAFRPVSVPEPGLPVALGILGIVGVTCGDRRKRRK
ncbi:MAG: PEP-CTERM sorting domain-containing protein, partial [Cyanobacteria bacterium J06559_3]